MKRINPINVLTYLFVFTFAYLLGIHSATPKAKSESEYVTVTARLAASRELPAKGDVCYIDKQTGLTVISSERDGETDLIFFLCEGKFYEAGFLTDGGRYLSANQPISPVFPTHTAKGRIIAIARSQER